MHYQQKLRSTHLKGEIEIDETLLFKEKKTFVKKRRPYKLGSVWLLGSRQRGTKTFIIIPVVKRDEASLMSCILKYVNLESTIYTDSFSVYVNNRQFIKKSKLSDYGYKHQFLDHSVEFVSELFTHMHTNTVERLWKEIKLDLKVKRITVGYLHAIARFDFHKTLTKSEQISFIKNCINSL